MHDHAIYMESDQIAGGFTVKAEVGQHIYQMKKISLIVFFYSCRRASMGFIREAL